MGLKSYLQIFRNSCCQSKSDYFDSSFKDEKKNSAEDFLKKNVSKDDDDFFNEKFNESSILKDEKLYTEKHVEINEASILSDENINQLRRRNPRLNRFDTDVIRLSLRKSLYSNNLEHDLENFLEEQQREAQKYENSESPYTLSDLRELYDLINNITIKVLESIGSEVTENQISDFEKSAYINISQDDLNINKILDDEISPEIINKQENSLKIDSENLEKISVNNKNSPINNSQNPILMANVSNINNNNNNNSLLCNSTEQSYIENEDTISKNEKRQISKNMVKSPDLNYSEIIYQSPNNETIDKLHNILSSSSQRDHIIDEITEPTRSLLCTSPQQSLSEITSQSPKESPKEELGNGNNNMFCVSPQQSFTDIICESPRDEIDNNNSPVLCSSPQQRYAEVVCQSLKDEFIDNKEQNILCSSPQQSYTDEICQSSEDELENNNKNNNIFCGSPQKNYVNMVCESPENELDDQKHNTLNTSKIQQNITDKICESPIETTENNHNQGRKSTDYGITQNTFGSFNSLEGNDDKSIHRNQGSVPTFHDKDLFYSQLKIKDNNSLLKQSILGSANCNEEKFKNRVYSNHSTLNSDSFQSIYYYNSIDRISSRKITRRGLKIINSKDTLNRQKPINLKQRNRKAVFIGINYTGKSYQLSGCVNDAKYIMEFLIRNYDFKRNNCKILTDDSKDETLIPTRENILNVMKWLVKDAKSGDSLFFHYSGHGLSIKDHNRDEIDGMDESILPIDYEENGVILDDLINHIMIKPLPKGCLLTGLADCCHSGTMFDLPYTYSCNGKVEDVKDIDENNEQIDKEYLSNEIYKKNKMVQEIVHKNSSHRKINLSLEDRISINDYAKSVKSSEADVIQFSSCRDNEISADERSNGTTYGALCNAFVSTLSSVILEEKTISYIELLTEIRKMIKKKYGQTPQISTSKPMDVSKPFEL
ncbi:caspase domain-containing protein [Neocallimastix sp. 'constans']|jgi:hypothetical protein